MSIVKIDAKYTGLASKLARGSGVATQEAREAQTEGYYASARQWHGQFRPGHFTQAAFGKYSYTPRKPRYEARKLREQGHRKPLVFSGESMRRTATARITATGKSGKAIMQAPRLNFRPRGGRINLREELLAVTTSEAAKLGKTFTRVVGRRITAAGGTLSKRIN